MAAWQEVDYSRFWEQFLDKCDGKTTIFSRCRGTRFNRLGAKHNGIYYQGNLRQHDSEVHAYIDFGLKAEDKNEAANRNITFFRALRDRKDEIEEKFGGRLEWIDAEDDEDTPRRCCIKRLLRYGFSDNDNWDSLQDEMIKATVRLEKVLRSYIIDMVNTPTLAAGPE